MLLDITGHHLDVTPTIKSYVESKFERLWRHFEHVTHIHVVLSVEKKTLQKAEAIIHVSQGEIFAHNTQEDLYAAIDGLVDKLDKQIKRHKEKLKDHHRGEKKFVN